MKDEEKIKNLEESLALVKNKKSKIYFLTQDTQGAPKASVAVIYEYVKLLNNAGYDAIILHEKDNYKFEGDENTMGLSDWLGKEYSSLPHASIESQQLKVGPSDFLIVPEMYAHVMEQTGEMFCTKIVLCQSYDYIFEMLQPGASWVNFGFNRVITTSRVSGEYIRGMFPGAEVSVIPNGISDKFSKSETLQPPVMLIHTREPRDTMKIVKSFYTKYPQFRWITFRDMRGMSTDDFASNMKEACGAVWVDDISGFGTFPLECMKSGVPVVGKIPNLKPEWLEEDNGFWTYDFNSIVDVINAYVKTWLEDSVPEELYKKMDETVAKYDDKTQSEMLLEYFGSLFQEKENDIANALNKFTEKEEK
jgi:hypothetical protein|tara:strand:+ start:8623 stop:9711 length:1089 start_codon:yes stop_codon:yes gene_type:complete